MYDRVLVITINSYYSKVPSTGTAVLLRSTVPTYGYCIDRLNRGFEFYSIEKNSNLNSKN